ncbi:MAG: hypothetical protein ACM3QS_14265 [Bacteroidota bacterium]
MPSRKLTKAEERQTRLSLFLGIGIWFLHQNLLNAFTSVACTWNLFRFRVAGLPGLQFIEVLISLVALAAMVYIIYLPWRNWRRFQTKQPPRNPQMLENTEEDRRPLLAFVAMLLNTFFLLFIIATFVPLLVVHACGSV